MVTLPPVVKRIIRNKALYLFLLPALVYIAVFNYAPIFGIQIAFRNFTPTEGIFGSPWVGLKYFSKFFSAYSFWMLLKNTLSISIYQLVVGFPLPIFLALALNYVPFRGLKKITQTVTYVPHFISVVVLVGMMFVFMSPSSGLINILLTNLGLPKIDFMGDPVLFRNIYVWTEVWQNTGWASVIYIATLAGISPEMHEAAVVDGANKLQRIMNIDIPFLIPTAMIILILNCGQIMDVGFEKVFLMQTAPNLSASEVISTYVYKIGIKGYQYSYASAIGLFNNAINFIIMLSVNWIANKTTNNAIW